MFGGAVASTIGKGLVDTDIVTMTTVLERCDRRICMEHRHVVVWFAVQFQSRADRRALRRSVAAARGNWSVIKWNEGALAESCHRP